MVTTYAEIHCDKGGFVRQIAMADEPDNLVLAMLRRMDQKLDHVLQEQGDHRLRLARLEEGLGHLRADVAGLHVDFAGLSLRNDRVVERLDRIERRLDLADAPRAPF
jgi:hypothetical protein